MTLAIADVIVGTEKETTAISHGPNRGPLGKAAIDSRQVSPGDLFIALHGEHEDGHQYITAAIEQGAAAVIGEHFPPEAQGKATLIQVRDSLRALQGLAAFWRAQHSVEVIGVTGSVGKTTTKEAVAALLASQGSVLKNEGNLNNEIGLPLTLLQLDGSYRWAVTEMGMYALGEIATLCDIAQPRVGVVTNVGPSHLERLGSLERIAQAKQELIEALPADGLAVLNGDDPRVRQMATATPARAIFYGLNPEHQVWADEVEGHSLSGLRFRLHWMDNSASVETSLPGSHNVYTALAAAATALGEGLDLRGVARSLEVSGPPLRLVVKRGKRNSTIIDDTYNSSPASCQAALDLLATAEGRKIAVLGDMLELGSFEEEGHRLVGRRSAEVADWLVAVGERGRLIGEEAQTNGMKWVTLAPSNGGATDHLLLHLAPGDVVLVKGSRGMAMEEIVARLEDKPCQKP